MNTCDERFESLNDVKDESVKLFLKNDGVRDEPFKLKIKYMDNNRFTHYDVCNEIPSLTYIIYKDTNNEDMNIFFEMTKEEWKLKKFTKDNKMVCFHPIEGMYIRYKKDMYMTFNMRSKESIIIKPIIVTLKYDNDKEEEIKYEYKKEDSYMIPINDDIINFDFFDDILYYDYDYTKLYNLLNNNKNIIIEEKINIFSIVKEKPAITIDDLIDKNNDRLDEDIKNFKTYDNRFIQRFHKKKYMDDIVCDFIVDECNKHNEWESDKYFEVKTQDVSVFAIETIKYYIIKLLENIFTTIKSSYCFERRIDFRDIFIVKYEADSENYLSMHTDSNFLSFQILLNNDFEGGGTYFADGITMKPEKGDLILHSGQQPHGGLPITKGKRYLLIGFVNIIEDKDVMDWVEKN